jgi:hypothetical protein
MLQYPSIPVLDAKALATHGGEQVLGFYKHDGSNLRWEWSPKQGWHKFGTRKQLFDKSTPLFNQAIPLFERMAGDIVRLTKSIAGGKVERITAFTEFFGPQSFAGQHDLDEPKELSLFDVFIYKKGFVPARQFHEVYGELPQACPVMYKGPLNQELADEVNQGEYGLGEGLILKGARSDFVYKVKTQAWYDRLKATHANWQELA